MAWAVLSISVGSLTAVMFRKWLRNSRKCPSSDDLNDKTVIITGANSGVGKSSAIELARRNARVILACRSLVSAKETAEEIKKLTGNDQVVPYEIDLSSFKSIRQFSEKFLEKESKIDVLVNNAGVFHCPYSKTEDGLEMQMGVNHFGHFLLTSLLLDRIKESAPSRIVVVSSAFGKYGRIKFDDINSEKSYSKLQAYNNSKLANLLFVKTLSEKLTGSGVDVFAVHPGLTATNIFRHTMPKFVEKIAVPLIVGLGMRDCDEGCQPLVFASVAKSLTGRSGVYIWRNNNEVPFPSNAQDDGVAQKLWELSESITQAQFKFG